MKRNVSYERFGRYSSQDRNWPERIAVGGTGGLDQRRSPRRPISMEVTLGQCVTCFGNWPIRNLSLHGAFLGKASGRMPVGTLLDVAFRCGSDGAETMRYVLARVVRVESGGMAVNFGRYGRGVHADLIALLRPT